MLECALELIYEGGGVQTAKATGSGVVSNKYI